MRAIVIESPEPQRHIALPSVMEVPVRSETFRVQQCSPLAYAIAIAIAMMI